MVRLDRTWDMPLPHKVGAEEHEGVRRAGDVSDSSISQTGIVYVWVRALVFLRVGRG